MPVVSRNGRCQRHIESVPNENSLKSFYKYLRKELGEVCYIYGDKIKKDVAICTPCCYVTWENQKGKNNNMKLFQKTSMDHFTCAFMKVIYLNTLFLSYPC